MKKFLLSLILISTSAHAYDHKVITYQVRNELASTDKIQLANRTDYALNALIRLAIWKLKHEGYEAKAKSYEMEWETKHQGFVSRYMQEVLEGRKTSIGDYAPLSKWLSDFYKDLESIFGKQILEFLHFDDINILNFTIPVVFHMEILGPVEIDVKEYNLHFDPFAGVVTYWSIWAGCEAATWGTGWFIICTPAGMLGEKLMVNRLAPKFDYKIYPIFWP